MSIFACAECEAIYREMREAAGELGATRGATRSANQDADSQELISWLSQLYEEECARMRENSSLWKTWRRWRDHRALTGHYVPLRLPPNAISNAN
jgi:hypothetical protein